MQPKVLQTPRSHAASGTEQFDVHLHELDA